MKAIIFDSDHTLYIPHTSEAYRRKFEYLGESTGIPSEKIRKVWNETVEELKESTDPEKRKRTYSTKLALNKLGVGNSKELGQKAVEIFWGVVAENLEPRNKAVDTLEELKGYKLAVASDEFRRGLEKKLNSLLGDWREYFLFLITPDSTGVMKPSEKYYEIAMERLGVDLPEVMVVGDSWRRDLEPAKKLGIKTVLLKDDKEGTPDYWVKGFEDLKEVLNHV